MDPEVARLADLLDELVALLTRHSQTHWAAWLARDSALLRAGDGYGITHFLGVFGGMGSLNDVLLNPGPSVSPDDARLRSLTGEAWTLASALRREAEGVV